MILPNETTVAVVDGEKLRLFRNKGMEPHIKLAEEAVAGIQPSNLAEAFIGGSYAEVR